MHSVNMNTQKVIGSSSYFSGWHTSRLWDKEEWISFRTWLLPCHSQRWSPSSSVLCCCRLHLPPVVPVPKTCCAHLFLQTSFPGALWSLCIFLWPCGVLYVQWTPQYVLVWQRCHCFCTVCVQASSSFFSLAGLVVSTGSYSVCLFVM